MSFTNLSSGSDPIDSYAWSFGDGATSAITNPVHVYTQTGSFTVVLTATAGTVSDSEVKADYILVTASSPVTVAAGFGATPTQGTVPLAVQFTDSSTPAGVADEWDWSFGDGGTSTAQHPVYTYTQVGVYTVTQQVTDTASGAWDVLTRPHYISVTDVSIAGLNATNDSPTSWGNPTHLTATVTAGSNVTYAWALGDGDSSSGAVVSHTYPEAGVYTAVVTASNSVNLITATTTVTITPVAGFTATPRQGIAPLVVQFTDTSSSGVDQWLWRFGDGGNSVVRHPVYTYTQSGVFTVTQTVTEITSGGRDTLTRTHYITVSGTGGSELVTRVITYTYDGLYRLAEADYSGGESFQYTYDAAGNMTALTTTITSTVVTTKSYDAANRLITVTTDGVPRTLEWSDAGELLQDGDDTYQWDAAGRLTQATVSGVTSRFAYLGDGSRISMTVGGETITYTLDVAAPLVQVLVANEDGTHTAYLYGVVRIAQNDGAWQYYLTDHLGSVRSLVNAEGSVAGTRAYQPYGAPLSSAGVAESVYGFTGEQADPTGLVFLRARYYSPYVGLFQSLDPWKGFSFQPQTLHGYTYVLNNPTTFSDPRGLLCILGFGNCHEEYDLFTLPYRFLPNDFCLPGGFGCWGGEEYADWLEKEYFPNLPIQDAVNNIIPQLPKSRVTDSYPFPCNDGPNNWDAWKAKHDLTSWLVTQMKENASGRTAQIIRNLLANGPDGFAAANVVWYMMVKGDAPWDFKKDLRQYGYFEVVLGKDWYGYDVPANIHYGYVGFAIGFDRQWLHFWAGAAQIQSGTSDWRWSSWFFDDPKDYEALRVGMDLFELYGSGITAERLTLLLEERKLLLNLAVAPKPPGYN